MAVITSIQVLRSISKESIWLILCSILTLLLHLLFTFLCHLLLVLVIFDILQHGSVAILSICLLPQLLILHLSQVELFALVSVIDGGSYNVEKEQERTADVLQI